MIDLDNNTNYNIDIKKLQEISNTLTKKDIELIITTNNNIQKLNYEHRNINKPTDVLSFPFEFNFENMPLGSIVISIDFVEEKARYFNHTFNDELSLLFIHGLLHLLGYDHEIDNGEHRKKEEELINQFKLPESLIIRNS